MKNLIIFTLLVALSACTNKSSTGVINKETSVASQGSGEFGIVTYGQNLVKSFVFKNNGLTAISGTPVITGSGFDIALQLGCETINPGKNCLVKIMFNSLNKESGNYSASLSVGDSTVNLTASLPTVPSVEYEFYVNNQVVNGNLDLGELSGTSLKLLTVKVKNISPKTGMSSSLTVSNPRFSVVSGNCNNVILKPNQSCIAKLIVKGDNSSNLLSSNLLFDSGVGVVSTQQSNVVYEGEMLSVASSIVLGDFYQEGKLKIQNLIIKNVGNNTGNIDSISLPPEYTLLHNNCSGIRPGNTCIIKLGYKEEIGGAKGQSVESVTIGSGSVDLIVNQVSKPNSLDQIKVTVNPNIKVDICSPVLVELKDNENLSFVSSSSINLTSSLSLYQDSNCSTSANLTLEPYVSSQEWFVRNSAEGPQTLLISKGGIQTSSEIYFYNDLVLSPLTPSINIGVSQVFTVNGGKTPITYEKISGVGELTGNTFVSNVAGTAVIKVTDSIGQVVQTEVTVNSTLIIGAGTCSYSVPETVNCQVSSSGGLGTKTYSTNQGVINSSSGVFYGECVNNLGSSEVTVTDQYGNTASVNLSYPCVYNSCNQLKSDYPASGDGIFWIDTDEPRAGTNPYQVFCDNTNKEGGWTLVAKFGTGNGTYHWFTTSSGTLSQNKTFVGGNTIQIAPYANSLVSRANEIKVVYGNNVNNHYVVGYLSTNKSYLFSGTPANLALGTLTTTPTSGYTTANYRVGATVRMHYGTYSSNLGSGFTSNVGANQTLGTIADCATYCSYRLPGIGTIEGSGKWGIEGSPIQVYVREAYVHPEPLPLSCLDAKNKGIPNKNGTYVSGVWTIDPDGMNQGLSPFDVACDQETDDGGWTIIQHRGSFSDFYLNWVNYKNGFGTVSLTGNYWIGNDRINALAPTASPKQVYFKLRDNLEIRYSKYASFSIGNELNKYVLGFSGYSGTAGDGFSYNGRFFSTKDVDNDVYGGNCAVDYKGAWWYGACHNSNLNGYYYGGPMSTTSDGVVWGSWRGHNYSLLETTIMIR